MSENDVSMANEGSEEQEELSPEEILLGGLDKIVLLPGHTPKAASFAIEREDHTLGNSLRYFINKNPDVEFCGYTIPHPSETKMHIRIQTWEDSNTSAFQALQKGLEDMIEACDVVTEKFEAAKKAYGPRDPPLTQVS